MIGAGLKKLAKQYNMKLDAGVAYGNLRGYAVTLFEGVGYKQVNISTRFPEVGQTEQLLKFVNEVNLEKEYRVQRLGVFAAGVAITFNDKTGTMKRIEAFIDWFFPLLDQHGAMGADVCVECGMPVDAGGWYLLNGFAHHLHDPCAQKVENGLAEEAKERKENDPGSYVQGAVGALLGALLGAAVWAVVLYLGYLASLVGLLIGWLANKGYDLFRGKQGKGKVAILIVVVILGVLIGTMAPDAVVLGTMIRDGELPGCTYGDIPQLIALVLAENGEYASGVVRNVIIGLLFAALGVFGLLRKTNREVSDARIKKLK